jgi:penicillin amidase
VHHRAFLFFFFLTYLFALLLASGKPILANDPHLGITTPSIWILMHLKSANTDVIGASFPGFPGLLSGHNERIAWGVTNGGTDVQGTPFSFSSLFRLGNHWSTPFTSPSTDLYLMDEVDYNSYNHNGSVLNYTIINEEIIIRDASPKILPVRKSVYGPVLIDSTAKHPSICLKWVSLDDDDATYVDHWHMGAPYYP